MTDFTNRLDEIGFINWTTGEAFVDEAQLDNALASLTTVAPGAVQQWGDYFRTAASDGFAVRHPGANPTEPSALPWTLFAAIVEGALPSDPLQNLAMLDWVGVLGVTDTDAARRAIEQFPHHPDRLLEQGF